MGRSSRIFGCLAVVVVLAPSAQAATGSGPMAAGVAMGGAMRGAPAMAARGARTPPLPARTMGAPRSPAPGLGRPDARGDRADLRRFDFRRHPDWRQRWRVGPYAAFDYGYGTDPGTAPYAGEPSNDAADGAGPDEPPYLPPPRPCVRPLIIKIGPAKHNATTTRVVYGTAPVCIRGY